MLAFVANLQIKDLPDPLHEELRRRAAAEGITVRSYVLRLIEADQQVPTRSEWLDRVRRRRPVDVSEDVAGAVRRDRAERGPAA